MGAEFKGKRNRYPEKRNMNLFYRPDRTTKPATVMLYVLFAFVCFLGLCKILVYDVWEETYQAGRALEAEQEKLNSVMSELRDYDEVKERYVRYAATEEERALVDRMEILAMLEETVGIGSIEGSISISGSTVQFQFSGATLAEIAQIVTRVEASPIVASTLVSTASTTAEGSEPVLANMLIQLKEPQEEVEEE